MAGAETSDEDAGAGEPVTAGESVWVVWVPESAEGTGSAGNADAGAVEVAGSDPFVVVTVGVVVEGNVESVGSVVSVEETTTVVVAAAFVVLEIIGVTGVGMVTTGLAGAFAKVVVATGGVLVAFSPHEPGTLSKLPLVMRTQ